MITIILKVEVEFLIDDVTYWFMFSHDIPRPVLPPQRKKVLVTIHQKTNSKSQSNDIFRV